MVAIDRFDERSYLSAYPVRQARVSFRPANEPHGSRSTILAGLSNVPPVSSVRIREFVQKTKSSMILYGEVLQQPLENAKIVDFCASPILVQLGMLLACSHHKAIFPF